MWLECFMHNFVSQQLFINQCQLIYISIKIKDQGGDLIWGVTVFVHKKLTLLLILFMFCLLIIIYLSIGTEVHQRCCGGFDVPPCAGDHPLRHKSAEHFGLLFLRVGEDCRFRFGKEAVVERCRRWFRAAAAAHKNGCAWNLQFFFVPRFQRDAILDGSWGIARRGTKLRLRYLVSRLHGSRDVPGMPTLGGLAALFRLHHKEDCLLRWGSSPTWRSLWRRQRFPGQVFPEGSPTEMDRVSASPPSIP